MDRRYNESMNDEKIVPLDDPRFEKFLAKRTPQELSSVLNLQMVMLDQTLEQCGGDPKHPKVQTVQRCMASVQRAIDSRGTAPKL